MNHTFRVTLAAAAIAMTGFGLAACSSAEPPVLGVWGTPDTRGEVSLEFTEDGRVAGSDGCNRVMGDWQADGNTITFGALASTMMACQDVEVWLVDPASAEVNGDTLVIFDSTGAELGTVERSK